MNVLALGSKGLLSIGVLICATVLKSVGQITTSDWKEVTLWIFTGFVGANTAHGVAAILKGGASPGGTTAPTPAPIGPVPPPLPPAPGGAA